MVVDIDNINSIMIMQIYCPSCYNYQVPTKFNKCVGCKMQRGSQPTNFRIGKTIKNCSTCETLNCNSCKGGR